MGLLSLFKKSTKTPPPDDMTFVRGPSSSIYNRWSNIDETVDDALAKYGYQLYKDMMNDGAVKSCLLVKTYGVTVGGHSVLPAVGDSEDGYEQAREIADFVEWNLSECAGSIESMLANIAGPAMKFGFSVNETNWKLIDKEPYKGMIGLASVKLRPSDTFTFDTDPHGNVANVLQRIEGVEVTVPLEKVLLYTYDPQQTGLPQGCSDLRAAYGPYKEKLSSRKWRAVAEEKFACPTVKGEYPPGTPPAKVAEFLNVLRTINVDTAIAVPTGMNVSLIESTKNVMAPYTETIDACNKEIGRAIFAQVLATDEGSSGSGSYAQARIHEGVLGMVLTDLRENVAETVLYEQLVKRLVDYNFDTSLYPKIKLAAPNKEDITALAGVIDVLTRHGFVDKTEQFVRQKFGFPAMPAELLAKKAEEAAVEAVPSDTQGADPPPAGSDEPTNIYRGTPLGGPA